MQNTAKTSRFLIDFSFNRELADSGIAVSRSKLLQLAVMSPWAYAASSRQVFNGLAKRLIQLAEHFFGLRDIDALREVSLVLQSLPIAEAQIIGQYYRALAVRRNGDIDESLPLLEAVADRAAMAYRARALQTLGAIYHTQGRIDEALRFYPEARRAASPENGCELLTTLLVDQELACIKSEMGDHRGALADYEKLSPLVQIVSRQNPLFFYLYHNELAVEFAELGRLNKAEAACGIAINSPFAPAYPEWSETREELEARRTTATPSVVGINREPEAELSPQAEPLEKREPLRACGLCGLASKRDFFQITVISTAVATVPNGSVNMLVILSCLRKCLKTRGPPALTLGTFKPLSWGIVESADEKARAAHNRFAVQGFCAQSRRFAISVCVSLCCRNYISRAPPLRRDGESRAGSLNRFASTSDVHSFKAYDDQYVRPGPVGRRQVSQHSQHGGLQRIWIGRRVCDSLSTLTAQVRAEELAMTNTRASAGGYL